MYDFRQVGGTHIAGMSPTLINIFIIIGFIMLTFGIFMLIFSHVTKTESSLKDFLSYVGGFFSILPIFIVIILLFNHFAFAEKYYFYEGQFKIVQSNAEKVDTTSLDDYKITIEDKEGNQQVIKVDSNDGAFKKDKLAYVKVKAFESDTKPTLKKPLESVGGFNNRKSIVKIKQVE